jgi:DNA-directed RNA polymerase subunit RPC12/RpoP
MNRTVYVCSRCGRTVENHPNWTRGWLIDTHKDAAKAFNGEMVIRCPDCITKYAIRNAERGRAAIRS